MLHSLKNLLGYGISAVDGEIGSVQDFYFDDRVWHLRYAVIDTGNWLPGRRVLLSPTEIERADWAMQRIYVGLTKDNIEKSPPVDSEKPVSRQLEMQMAEYFAWPAYWSPTGAIHPAAVPIPAPKPAQSLEREKEGWNVHLRSFKEVCGYHIHATDGSIGHVEDLIAHRDDWRVRYLVVDTRNWLPGKKVLVVPDWIRSINWDDRTVSVELTQTLIENGPTYDPAEPVNREFETKYYDYYGRPKYWTD
jgi:uncharacterized protein YrrD